MALLLTELAARRVPQVQGVAYIHDWGRTKEEIAQRRGGFYLYGDGPGGEPTIVPATLSALYTSGGEISLHSFGFVSFSCLNPGVSVSGGYAMCTPTPTLE